MKVSIDIHVLKEIARDVRDIKDASKDISARLDQAILLNGGRNDRDTITNSNKS